MSAWEAMGKTDEWYTPKVIFDALEVRFDLDVAAPIGGPRHVPCVKYLTQLDDGLTAPWRGFVWMNPPFGRRNGLVPWLERFIAHGNGIALVPDRTSTPWWQTAAAEADAVLFIRPKVKFERPDGSVGKSPGCGTCLLAAGSIARRAFLKNGWRIGLVMEWTL